MASLESSLKYESGVSGGGGSRSVATEAYPLDAMEMDATGRVPPVAHRDLNPRLSLIFMAARKHGFAC